MWMVSERSPRAVDRSAGGAQNRRRTMDDATAASGFTAHAPSLVPRKYPAAAFEFELEPKPTLYEIHKSQ
jgi:hypothetical protein